MLGVSLMSGGGPGHRGSGALGQLPSESCPQPSAATAVVFQIQSRSLTLSQSDSDSAVPPSPSLRRPRDSEPKARVCRWEP